MGRTLLKPRTTRGTIREPHLAYQIGWYAPLNGRTGAGGTLRYGTPTVSSMGFLFGLRPEALYRHGMVLRGTTVYHLYHTL